MAYDVTNFNDFIAREAKPLTKALFMGDNTGLYSRVMTNVKGSTSVPHIGGEAVLQKGNCKTPTGTSTITEVILTVQPLVFAESVCTDDLQDKFPNTVLASGSNTRETSPRNSRTFILSKKFPVSVKR